MIVLFKIHQLGFTWGIILPCYKTIKVEVEKLTDKMDRTIQYKNKNKKYGRLRLVYNTTGMCNTGTYRSGNKRTYILLTVCR